MDNVIAIQAAIADLNPVGEGALQINYTKALVDQAIAQQQAACDSRGRMYSRSSGSRAASSAARRAGEGTIVNAPPAPQQQQPAIAYSTNEPCP